MLNEMSKAGAGAGFKSLYVSPPLRPLAHPVEKDPVKEGDRSVAVKDEIFHLRICRISSDRERDR